MRSERNRAWGPWRAKTAKEQRLSVMRNGTSLMMGGAGRPWRSSDRRTGQPPRGEPREVRYGASFNRVVAEEGKRIYGDVIPSNARRGRRLV